MASTKPFPLTSENLKAFEKQLNNQNRGKKSLQRDRNVERTEADGQSSGIQSYGSQLSAFKENLRNNNNQEENKQVDTPNRKYSYSLDRPEPEAFRRNPDGQSRNESWHATPNVVRIDYGEGRDHISYKSNSEEENPENDDDDDDDDDDSDDDDDDDDDSEEESSESDEESDEESEDDDNTDTIPPRLQVTPVSVRTHYSSSLNASSSSIPTIASVKSKAESTKTTKTERQKSVASNVSSAPSYIVNTNQFRMKKMAAKKQKERQKLGVELIESDLSRGSSRNRSAVSRASMRERGTTSVQSRGSYITVRNWSQWSNYSAAGYSISEGPENNHRYRKLIVKKKTAQNMRAKTPRARPQSRTQVPHLPVIGKKALSKSQPDLSKASKRHVTLTFPDLTRTRSVSRSQMTSRMSTRSIMKPPTAQRIKSVPDLNREAVMSFFQIERGFTGSVIKTGSKRQYISRQRQAKKQDNGLDDETDFRNRRKRVLKRKERPKRNATTDSSASSTRSIIKQRSKRGSTKNDERSPLSSALSMSSLKSREIETGRGGKASSSASSQASVISRGPRMKPIRTYAGYQSNQDFSSSRVSLLAPATPISVILQRSPSLRSAITEYSSYLSLAASSVKSARYSSRSNLSSTDGESSAVGPQVTSPHKEEEKQNNNVVEKQTKPEKEEPPRQTSSKAKKSSSVKQEKQSDSETEQLQLPPIRPQTVTSSDTKSPYNSSVRVETPKEVKEAKKKQKKQKVKLPHIVRVSHPLPDFTEATRDTGITRLMKLAKPKESKAVWMTSFWPLVWGNQETMWPISRAALSANASERLMALATPKKDFQQDHPVKCNREQFTYSCGRESVIWGVQPLALKANISARLAQLAEPKPVPEGHKEQREAYIFSCGRSSPIWHVSEAAKTAEERERSLRLASPKKPHPHYQPEREVPWLVSETAKRVVTSARVEQLARPKTRQDGLIREPTWRVSSASRRTVASARVQELAKPKQTAEGYFPCKEVEWPVSRNTLRAMASERTQTLAKPIIRETMDHVQFNPDAFTVSESARKANPSQRIVELAQPLSRGHK